MKGEKFANFGTWVRETRLGAGMTIEQLANRMRFSKSYVGAVETGVKPPTNDFCIAFADAMNMDRDEVMALAGSAESKAGDDIDSDAKAMRTELIAIFSQMTDRQQREFIRMARALRAAEKEEEEAGGTSRRPRGSAPARA